jgi:hypothetical protein
VTTTDTQLCQRLIRRALELRHASTASRSPTWARDQLEQATARNHYALAAVLVAHRVEPETPADRQLEDREAEP